MVEDTTAAGLGNALETVAEQASLRLTLRQAGLGCAAGFSWRKTAEETAAALLACGVKQSPEREGGVSKGRVGT